MFDFLWWGLYPLWKKLLELLLPRLGERGGAVISQFKLLLASTLDDLSDAIVERIREDELWKLWAEEEIARRNSNDDSSRLTLQTFPLNRLRQTPTIAPLVAEKLKTNVDLGAARNSAGIDDAEWERILREYSQRLVEYGVFSAIERMIKQKKQIWLGIVLLVQKNQAYKVNGHDGFYDMVKVYEPPASRSDGPSVAKAHRIWKSRSDASFEYKRGEYMDSGFSP